MALKFSPKVSLSNTEQGLYGTDGAKTVWTAYHKGGTGTVIRKSTDQLSTFGSEVTVDSSSATSNPCLNDPIHYDQVTGRLHIVYAQNENSGGSKPTLNHRYSDDGGSTWSAQHQIDDGSVHSINMFVRAAIYAHNGHVSVWYECINGSTFIGDGLYRSLSSDGGATWSSPTRPYSAAETNPAEPNIAGDGLYVICTWYDPNVAANQGGNLYCSRSSDAGVTWSAARELVATGTFGRPRPAVLNGRINIVANSTWGGSVADVSTVLSTDFGTTWGSATVRATHGSGPLDHPSIAMVGHQVFIFWVDQGTSPISYGAQISTDDGATYGSTVVPMTQTGSSDAPFVFATEDYAVYAGHDGTANTNIYTRYAAFAAQIGSLATLDAFNRANESPLSGGGNWTSEFQAGGQLRLVSNAVQRTQVSPTFERDGSRYTAVTISANQPSAAKFKATRLSGTGGDVDVFLINNAGSAMYEALVSADGTFIGVTSTGAGGLLGSAPFGGAAGDLYELQIDVDDIVLWLQRATDIYELLRVPNTDNRLAWQGGLEISDDADTTPSIVDDFGVAQLVAPSNSAAPTISGTLTVGSALQVSSDGTWATANGATPYRFTYQWQTSPDGSSWSDVTGETRWYYIVTNASLYHRVVVTAKNTIGSTTANSAALNPGTFYTILNGSDQQLVNVNAGGTDVDALSYKDGVSLTSAELATLLDGSTFGRKDVAVMANLSGDAASYQKKKILEDAGDYLST